MPEKEFPFTQFDEATLSAALRAHPEAVTDPRHGSGRRLRIGAGELRLEVFAATGTTRLTTPGASLELGGALAMQEAEGGVVLSRQNAAEDVHVALRPDGTVMLGYVHCPPEAGPSGGNLPDDPAQHLPPASPVPGPRDALQTDVGDPLPSAAAASPADATSAVAEPARNRDQTPDPGAGAREGAEERIALTGRLGRDPSFRTTKTGSQIGRFLLAVHREDGHTDWHTVLAFGSRAEQLERRVASGELTQGREVDVVGYVHVNERPGKDGKLRQVQEVYAVAVKKR